ncbi:MAG: YjbQ family protein [Thermoplasmata archaeon]|nr:MAG: YjbQ family protein [Thermoplasmata archaeon]
MKIKNHVIEFESSFQFQYVDITDEVEKVVKKEGIREGVAILHEMHTTGAIVIQEDDPTIHEDTHEILEEIVPTNKDYRHGYEGNINAAAHIRNQLLGSNVSIPIVNGRLALGTWQRVFFIEMFRPRHRKVVMSIIGD